MNSLIPKFKKVRKTKWSTYLIGRFNLCEWFCRAILPFIHIRVILQSETFVGLFDVGFGGEGGESKHGVMGGEVRPGIAAYG